MALCGKSRREVLSFLKEAPPPFTLVCCRPLTSDSEAEKESERRGRGVDDVGRRLRWIISLEGGGLDWVFVGGWGGGGQIKKKWFQNWKSDFSQMEIHFLVLLLCHD